MTHQTTLALSFASGCSTYKTLDPAEEMPGALALCYSGQPAAEDTVSEVEGSIVPTPVDHCAEMDHVVSVESPTGEVTTVGLTVRDGREHVVPLSIDLADGSKATLRYRTSVSFGTAAGFVLRDEVGLLMAANQGTWGGALDPSDLDELSVLRGEVVGEIPGACQGRELMSLYFETGAGTVGVDPFGSSDLATTPPLTAVAVSAYDWMQGDACAASDASNDLGTWLVYRPLDD